jgi:peptidoglycan/LPS O-acetylase OafA/YrhL
MFPAKKLNEVILPNANNTDLIRLILACLVIFGHATTISPQIGYVDFSEKLIGVSSSSVAVWIFFFLSGLLVANSLIEKKRMFAFICSRFFRIWPALFVLVLLTTTILGPFFTEKSIQEYFSDVNTKEYFLRNIRLAQQYFLPGVFLGNPSKEVVNGSLWSIPYEVYAYLWLLLLFFSRLLNKWIVLFFFVLLIIDFISVSPIFVKDRATPLYLTLDFTIGVLFALWKDKINLDIRQLCFLAFAYYFFRDLPVAPIILHLLIFVSVLLLSSGRFFLKFKPKFDLSYGVYLWGYAVAQVLVFFFPGEHIYFHQFFSIFISLCIAYLSCVLVERPSIKFGAKLVKRLYG